ncbi:MAG: DUF4340 domain-containing protein [Candidatus Limiplasma sp.]|nr:DUF4340 domain-containing protein [Candidatus Limiplasma sp.]
MKTLIRSLIITGAVVAALAAVFAALRLAPAPRGESGAVFTAVEPVEISSVRVENATGSYRYYYEGDGYVLDDIPGTLVDLDAFIGFMTGCGRLSAVRRLQDASLEQYGLQTPAAKVEMEFFNGTPVHMTLGAQEKISGGYYAAVEGFPGVYLMERSMAEPFLRPKTQVISKQVTPPLKVSSPLSAIRDVTFSGGPLDGPVTIQATSGAGEEVRLAALSFGTATHLVRGAGAYQLDQTYGVEILGSLFGIPARDVVGYNLTREEVAALGFDAPWMRVEYDMVNGANAPLEHCVLSLVRLGEDAFYATLEGSGVVYSIGRQPFMDIRYDKLLLRWFLTPMLMDISAVTVQGEGRSARFKVDNADPKAPVVTYGEDRVDITLFRSFFRLLTSAAHDGTYLGSLEQPQGEALLTITYEYADPGKEPDVLALYPGQVRRAGVWVNGVAEFAMKDQFIQRVLEGCESLLAGKPIEENW